MGLAALRRREGQTADADHIVEVDLFLNDLDPKAVRVELYADGIGTTVRSDRR